MLLVSAMYEIPVVNEYISFFVVWGREPGVESDPCSSHISLAMFVVAMREFTL